MKTGYKGTFVISWSQTETDGLRAAPLEILAVGASWRWSGETVRIDGAQGLLVLEGADGAADIRRRAARIVRRLIGSAIRTDSRLCNRDDIDMPERSFVVTDGLKPYTVTLIDVPDTGGRLLMFADDVPPADTDLWVVRLSLGGVQQTCGPRLPGGVICFTPGTTIRTADGVRRIEDLGCGDLIQTKDNGLQRIMWSGQRRMTGARLHAMPHLRPIRFRAGALGIGRPDHELLVSPQHRMLVKGPAAVALFNNAEVLIAAEDLVNDISITVDQTLREVTYVHILLEQHQVIWANGLETESFHPANTAMDMIDPAQREGLFSLLPALAENPHAYGDHARRNLSRSEAAILRHELAA